MNRGLFSTASHLFEGGQAWVRRHGQPGWNALRGLHYSTALAPSLCLDVFHQLLPVDAGCLFSGTDDHRRSKSDLSLPLRQRDRALSGSPERCGGTSGSKHGHLLRRGRRNDKGDLPLNRRSGFNASCTASIVGHRQIFLIAPRMRFGYG